MGEETQWSPARVAVVAVLGLALSGCSHLSSFTASPAPEALAPAGAESAPPSAASAPPPATGTTERPPAATPPRDLWERLRRDFRLNPGERPRIAVEAARWGRHGRDLGTLSRRAAPFLHYVVSRVEERGMPGEVALLPFVESGFDPRASSPFEAAGLWQFMPATAAHFGLARDWWYDGRHDVVQSTTAALDYLAYLNRLFDGDWLLALAAYNAGEGTVRKAMEANRGDGRPEDYWSLDLPEETQAYVPRLLALARVIADPASHGVRLHPLADSPRLAVLELEAPLELALAAELAGLDHAVLRRLNPGYLRWATAPGGPHHLVLPAARVETLRNGLAAMPADEWMRWHRHRVAPGDSLYLLARRYDTTVATLKRINAMDGTLLRVGRDLKVPRAPTGESAAPAPARHYTVRRGDSLWTIARRVGTPVDRLARLNGLPAQPVLQPGQRLRLGSAAAGGDAGPLTHVVRPGDTLWHIARRFKVRVADLTRWNDLARTAVLRPGQVLVLYPRADSA